MGFILQWRPIRIVILLASVLFISRRPAGNGGRLEITNWFWSDPCPWSLLYVETLGFVWSVNEMDWIDSRITAMVPSILTEYELNRNLFSLFKNCYVIMISSKRPRFAEIQALEYLWSACSTCCDDCWGVWPWFRFWVIGVVCIYRLPTPATSWLVITQIGMSWVGSSQNILRVRTHEPKKSWFTWSDNVWASWGIASHSTWSDCTVWLRVLVWIGMLKVMIENCSKIGFKDEKYDNLYSVVNLITFVS